MSSWKSKNHRKSDSVKKITVEANAPALIVVTKDKIQRLRECNPNKSFTMLLFYFGLLFSCGLVFVSDIELNKPGFIVVTCSTILLCFLFVAELINYIKKKDLFEKILSEIESEEGKILLD